ncbi:hypothetical protein ABD76_04055 [Paenibacillus dendritiformis]|nr:hypothetical protein [Paenibacillus dendritiformis]
MPLLFQTVDKVLSTVFLLGRAGPGKAEQARASGSPHAAGWSVRATSGSPHEIAAQAQHF